MKGQDLRKITFPVLPNLGELLLLAVTRRGRGLSETDLITALLMCGTQWRSCCCSREGSQEKL